MMRDARAGRLMWPGLLAIAAVLVCCGALDAALAQNPFGAGPGSARSPGPDGIIGWIMTRQSEFYRGLSGMIRAAKRSGTIEDFIGRLAGKTRKVATIEEINEAAANGWAGIKGRK